VAALYAVCPNSGRRWCRLSSNLEYELLSMYWTVLRGCEQSVGAAAMALSMRLIVVLAASLDQ